MTQKMIIEYDAEVTMKPEHLNVNFYKKIIQIASSVKDVEIVKVFCSMGSKTGENYCSFIYRANIQFETKQNPNNIESLSVIIKSMPKSEAAQFLEHLDAFSKECTIYYEILPKLESLFDKNQRFGPRIYHSVADPVKTLVFEDLGSSRYKMASREQGLDEIHAQLALKRLAQLHASSMVMSKKTPGLLEGFTTGMIAPAALENDNGMLMVYFTSCANSLIAAVSKWPGYESILDKLKNYVSNFRENLIASSAPISKDEIKVLNHGDLWINNMLYQYDMNDIDPVNMLFVDFQMSLFGSPGIDLNYFFYTSLQLELLKTKRNELLTHYHHVLCSTLEDLSYSNLKPTLQQIFNEFEHRAPYGFFASFALLPTICQDKQISDDSCIENFMDEEFAKRKIERMYQSERVQNTLKFALKEFDKLEIWN